MRAVILLGALGAAGCGGSGRYVQRGMDAYNAGAYPEAMETFVWIQKEGLVLNAKGSCRYITYRGLTAARLGKRDEAEALLVKGRDACATDPRWLPPPVAAEAETTLKALGGS